MEKALKKGNRHRLLAAYTNNGTLHHEVWQGPLTPAVTPKHSFTTMIYIWKYMYVYTGVRRYKLVLKDKTRPCITQNGSPGPPEHPGTHTRAQNDLAGPGSGARYAVVGHPEVGFWPFRSKVPLNLN